MYELEPITAQSFGVIHHGGDFGVELGGQFPVAQTVKHRDMRRMQYCLFLRRLGAIAHRVPLQSFHQRPELDASLFFFTSMTARWASLRSYLRSNKSP